MDALGPLFEMKPVPKRPPPLGAYGRWARFHRDNPEIYERLVALAREAKAAGCKKLGMRLLWERLRWDITVKTKREGGPKLNDHFPPYYARLISKCVPELAAMFELRGRP